MGAGWLLRARVAVGLREPALPSCRCPDPWIPPHGRGDLPLHLLHPALSPPEAGVAGMGGPAAGCSPAVYQSQRCPPSSRAQLTRPCRSCRDPAVHNALFSGDLQQIQALFQDEGAANMIVETVSNQLAWSAEQGREHPVGAEEEGEGGGGGAWAPSPPSRP